MIGTFIATKFILKKSWKVVIGLVITSLFAAVISNLVMKQLLGFIEWGTFDNLYIGGFVICTLLWSALLLFCAKLLFKIPVNLKDPKFMLTFFLLAYILDGVVFYFLGEYGVPMNNGFDFIIYYLWG